MLPSAPLSINGAYKCIALPAGLHICPYVSSHFHTSVNNRWMQKLKHFKTVSISLAKISGLISKSLVPVVQNVCRMTVNEIPHTSLSEG